MLRWGEMRACHEDLVGQEIADAGDGLLIEQPRLDRRASGADPPAELIPADLGGIGADVGEVGVQHRAAEPALVAQDQAAAVGELEREAVPARRVAGIDHDPSGHPEVQPERWSVVGLEPHELAAPMRGGQGVAGEGGRDLARRVRPAHVRVAIVDRRDRAAQGRLERPAGAFGFGQLRHRRSSSVPPEAAAPRPPTPSPPGRRNGRKRRA